MADIQEHKNAVAKYAKNIHTAALDGMAKNYALVLSNKDSQYVASTDDGEKATVRENFLKKKLGLTHSDDELNAAIEEIGQLMKEDHFKSRLAYYYLLAEKYNKLEIFA
jgi:hypothetical protein